NNLLDARLKSRDGSFGRFELSLGPRSIELVAAATIEQVNRQLVSIGLVLGIAPRHRQAILGSAEIEIISRYFSQDADEHIVERCLRGRHFCLSRLDRATDVAEKVQLPCCIET